MPNKLKQKKKGKNKKSYRYRSHHTDYGLFLKYIDNHIGIDDRTVTRTKNRLGTFSSNNIGGHNNNNYSDHHKMTSTMSKTDPTDPMGQLVFSNQSSQAKTKAEIDDARHEHLHTNVKNADLNDKDKIFLLKREIDNLQGQLRGAEKAGYQRSNNTIASDNASSLGLPLMSAFLVLGLLLVTSKFLARKIRTMRTAGSLLLDEGNLNSEAAISRNYEYSSSNSNEGIVGFELQEHPQPAQGGLFAKIASTLDTTTKNSSDGGPVYEAPSASVSFL